LACADARAPSQQLSRTGWRGHHVQAVVPPGFAVVYLLWRQRDAVRLTIARSTTAPIDRPKHAWSHNTGRAEVWRGVAAAYCRLTCAQRR
jgi:hypothetical protein